MKILFDAAPLCVPNLTSTGNYVKNLALALREREECDLRPVIPADRWNGQAKVRTHLGFAGPLYIPFLSDLNLGSAELYHGTSGRLPRSLRFAKVATVHDMVGFRTDLVSAQLKQQRQAEFDEFLVANEPDAVIVPTAFVRDEVAAFVPALASRLVVIPHGADHVPVPARKPASPYPFPYILFIGTGERRKNAVNAALAFAQFAVTHPDVRLVVVGMGQATGAQLRQRISQPAVRERVILPGYLPMETLIASYMNAVGLFFPSLYEGFCLPVLEAMRLGCPVVTSRTGAMLELAGDAALLTEPRDITHMAEALRFITEDRGLTSDLIARGKERSAAFTWAACAEKTAAVYRKAIDQRRR
jgi:glycosyltransferase involved in cell wall biosynthesis